ncbi:biotin biosynthesis protein BioY [Corynebacterium phocae]|uniref:Biotin transporter n=1 Tax=Corynebacterium phocae TaxID=161895 RepID=A0A1L7D2Q8_9CORY|nr:biotin transporter BioY [Corynebacterium phocae]APT92363.1 biotin biosynthesis protein BioY [Corynebacterium phocae]KAA8724954.1 biotin transporter BioY [Corynebacterium phocae]
MYKNSTASNLAYIAVFTALVIVLAFVSIPTGAAGVPIVLQNAALILAGLVLGGRRGLYVGLLFLLLGLAFPVLAGGRTVLAALSGPTVGYIIGYIFAPFVSGAIAYRAPRSKGAMTGVMAAAALAGLAIQYGLGIAGLILRAGMDLQAAVLAQAPFIGFDLIKMAVIVAIAVAVHAAFPELMGRRNSTNAAKVAHA